MAWPMAADYAMMVQIPAVAFRDPELQSAAIQRDGNGFPSCWGGVFAIVFRATLPSGQQRAVKVFTSAREDRAYTYGAISDYLRHHRPISSLIGFQYQDRGIRGSDGRMYPLVIMDWVHGTPLFDWLDRQCTAGNATLLGRAAERWCALVDELADAQIAHGDLSADNVRVNDADEFKLIDYDGMCVPALVGRRNQEIGCEPYQHPQRDGETLLTASLDNFSTLFIYVALRALAAQPRLWIDFVARDGYDKLLIRTEDLQSPNHSELFKALCASPDREVAWLALRLCELYRADMNSVPPLRDVLSSSDKVRFLQRERLENETAINVRLKAWSSFQSVSDEASQANDERRVTAWREELFSGWNLAEAERGKLQASLDRLQLLARLRQTIDSLGSPPRLDGERQIIALAAPLGDYVSDVTARVQQAQVRIHAFERFHNAIRAAHSEAAIVQAWIELQRAEGETLADPAQQHRAALAQERLRLLQHLHQLPHSLPPDQLDRHLLAIWHPLLEECLEARPWNVAYQTAMRRSRVLQQIRAAYERNDDAAQAELIRDPAMSGYSWPPEIAQSASAALDRIARGQKLMASVETGDRAAFRERFDQRLLCQSAAQFAPYRDLLKRWIVEEILPCRKMGLDLPIGTSAVAQQRSPPNSYVARWRWPNSRFTDTCVLAICKQLPKDGKHPQSLDIHEQLNVPRHIYEARGGHVVHSLPAWAGSYIVVWALVETGWETLTSEPLVLGRLPGASWTMVTARAKWYRPILNWFRQITLSTDSTVHPDQRQCKEREDLPPRNDGNEGERPECPNCGSARMRLEADEAAWICDACGFHWNPATSAPPPPVLQRHTDVSFPQEVPVQITTTLRIQFVPAEETTPEGQVVALPKPHAHDVTLPFHVPKPVHPHQPPPPIRVHISVVAENFAVEGSSEAEVVVPLLGRSVPVPFRLQGLCVGPGRIVVDFDQSGRHVGSVELRPNIVAADAQPASDQAPTQGEVRPVAQPGPAPDAVIKVFEFRLAGQPGRLHFVFSSADPRLKDLSIAMEGDLGTVDLRSEVAPWVEGQLKRIGEVARRSDVAIDEVQRKLRDVGHDLFDQLLPPGLQELTWTLQQRGIRRVLVLSDEPHIPWELIKPYRKNAFTSQFEDEAPFWGESYALTRWLRGRVPPDHLRLQRAVTVTATGSNLPETAIRTTRDLVPEEGADGCASEPAAMVSEDALLSTDEERAVSHCLTSSGVRVRSLHPRKRSLEQLFAAADFDLLHLVSHGAFGGATAADASALMMEDGPFQAIDLSPSMEAALRAAAPLVFFNACHSGRIGLSLTRLGSWGARLVQLGCGGFVGALWPVTDEAAPVFANSFYESLIAGKSIAEAVQIARHKTRERFPADPTWLAYCCYADPMATVAADR